MSTEPMRAAFEAWLDEPPHEFNPRTTNREITTAMERVVALRAWQAATLAERERCAEVCEGMGDMHQPEDYADEIRKGSTP